MYAFIAHKKAARLRPNSFRFIGSVCEQLFVDKFDSHKQGHYIRSVRHRMFAQYVHVCVCVAASSSGHVLGVRAG